MIENGELTYASAETPWYAKEFSNVSLNSLAIASAVSLVALQTSALLIDLLLGAKAANSCKQKAFGILLLSWNASPLAVSNALLRKDWLTRLYYRGDIPQQTQIARDDDPVRLSTCAVVIMVIAVAPLIDSISIVLPLKKSRKLTFAEAGFQNVSFGINKDLSYYRMEPHALHCERPVLKSRTDDDVLTTFLQCESPLGAYEGTSGKAEVSVFKWEDKQLKLSILLDGIRFYKRFRALIMTDQKQYDLRADVDVEAAQNLAEMGLRRLSEHCNDVSESESSRIGEDDLFKVVASKSISCQFKNGTDLALKLKVASTVLESLKKRLTLVPSEEFIVTNTNDDDLRNGVVKDNINGAQIEVIDRRARNLGFLSTILLASGVVIARLVCSFFISNDVISGMDSVLKDKLLVSRDQSLIAEWNRAIEFRKKHQLEEVAHLGLAHEFMPEVTSFDGGVVGGFGLPGSSPARV